MNRKSYPPSASPTDSGKIRTFIFALLFGLGALHTACAQELIVEDNEEEFTTPDQQPELDKGDLQSFFTENLHSPGDVVGKVFITFLVDKTGRVKDAKILKGLRRDCDSLVMAAILKTSGHWIPGMNVGKPVKVRMTLPVVFKVTEFAVPDFRRREQLIYHTADVSPVPPEGDMNIFIKKHLIYPEDARKNGIKGSVLVGAFLEKDGEVTHVRAIKGLGYGCDEEAVRVVLLSSCLWKPAIKDLRIIRKRLELEVRFGE